MDENRRKILEMLSQGKITPADAERLLEKLKTTPEGPPRRSAEVKVEASGGLGGLVSKLVNFGLLGSVAKFSDTRLVEVAHQPGAALRVRTGNGAVNVIKNDGDKVSIRAEIRALSAERLAAAQVLAVRAPDGTLDVSVDWPDGGPKSCESCSFEITLPDARGVDIASTNGRIGIAGLAGTALLKSTNAAITVRGHDGSLRVGTTNGSIAAADVRGEVLASSTNGKILVERAQGAVEATTSNGRVEIQQSADACGAVRVKTSNGSVALELGVGFIGDLRLSTSNGRVKIEGAEGARVLSINRTSAHVAMGAEGPESYVKTSNGGIQARFLKASVPAA